ncbi:unnamed protein product [Dovyalis caffra]|uniref:Uncharacterized protein n=1 Tax=Dovyalis caffra TaxID=77055 RepID=A0AAV1RXH1_9ROSI|nr:unnamed protein product [Dovyalis caffra]
MEPTEICELRLAESSEEIAIKCVVLIVTSLDEIEMFSSNGVYRRRHLSEVAVVSTSDEHSVKRSKKTGLAMADSSPVVVGVTVKGKSTRRRSRHRRIRQNQVQQIWTD